MKKFLLFLLISIVFSCQKEKFEAPEDFNHFVGTWKSINSDEKMEVLIFKNGKLEVNFDIQRSLKRHFQKVEILESWNSGTFYLNFFNKKTSSSPYINFFVNSTKDTIYHYFRVFNQQGNSTEQNVNFIKVK